MLRTDLKKSSNTIFNIGIKYGDGAMCFRQFKTLIKGKTRCCGYWDLHALAHTHSDIHEIWICKTLHAWLYIHIVAE